MFLPPHFHYINGQLHCEHTPLATIAREHGTPTWVYSQQALTDAWQSYSQPLQQHDLGKDALVCYAVKANSNLSILRHFAQLGAGFDIVSQGELQRVLTAGGAANKVIFSGVGKKASEMKFALEYGILCFNVESEAELARLNQVAGELGQRAPVSLRVNPNVDAKTHPYISTGMKQNKFGIAHEEAVRIYQYAASLPHLNVIGIDCHIGSQLTEIQPFVDALDKLLELIDTLAQHGIVLHHLDVGGGLGIQYQDEVIPPTATYIDAIMQRIQAWQTEHPAQPLQVLFEPGRSLVGNAGCLLSEVEFIKHQSGKNFAIIDAAMNDLMRPAMYQAFHEIATLKQITQTDPTHSPKHYDVVGPVCESGDWIGKDRALSIAAGDYVAILSAGAYGMTMSSNYNTRPRGVEVLVDGANYRCIRQRESFTDLIQHEVGL